jgi:carbon storage regulator
MLLLKRRAGERVVISDDIVVDIVSVKGGVVILGIGAPKEMKILRQELIDRKSKQKDDTTE